MHNVYINIPCTECRHDHILKRLDEIETQLKFVSLWHKFRIWIGW